eukprot:gene198-4444_t
MNEEALYIGIPDKKITNIEDNDIYINKIGGKAVWMNEKQLEKPPKEPKELKCKICSSKLYLISQIYAPLSELDRFLYIFGCNNEKCINKEGRFENRLLLMISWIGIRGSCDAPEEEEKEEKKVENWKETVEDDEIFDLIKEKKEPNKKKNKQKKEDVKKEYHFPCNSIYFFEDEYDSEDENEMKTHEKRLYREYQKNKEKIENDDDDEEEEDDEEEMSEETAFQKFQTVLQECPNQVVRTKFDMKVLWTTYKKEFTPTQIDNDEELKELKGDIVIPDCDFCKAKRVPEVQILSTSVYFLEPENHCHLKENEGLDFGTVILYVCSKNCQKGAYVDEFILVQPPFNQ